MDELLGCKRELSKLGHAVEQAEVTLEALRARRNQLRERFEGLRKAALSELTQEEKDVLTRVRAAGADGHFVWNKSSVQRLRLLGVVRFTASAEGLRVYLENEVEEG